jgi:hypothetical protein
MIGVRGVASAAVDAVTILLESMVLKNAASAGLHRVQKRIK